MRRRELKKIFNRSILWFTLISIPILPVSLFLYFSYMMPLIESNILYSTLVASIIYYPIFYYTRRMPPLIDHYFKKDMRDLKQYMEDYKLDFIQLSDIDELVKRNIELIEYVFSLESYNVILLDERREASFFSKKAGKNSKVKKGKSFWKMFDEMFVWITEYGKIFEEVDIGLIITEKKLREKINKFFEYTKSSVIIPLLLNDSLLGLLCLGRKKSGKDFSMGEYSFLRELKHITSIAFGNAILYQRLIEFNKSLELKVKQRTQDLEEAQSKVVHTEKLAGLGVMVAGIAHEINTPSSVINVAMDTVMIKSQKLIRVMAETLQIKYGLKSGVVEHLLDVERRKLSNSSQKFIKKKQVKKGFVERYKLSQEESDVKSHFIVDQEVTPKEIVQIAKMNIRAFKIFMDIFSMQHNLKNIAASTKAILKIVSALKYYSHLDQSQKKCVHLVDGIKNTLIVLNNQLKNRIKVIEHYNDLPPINCLVSELNQVWTNLIMNAVQASPEGGTIKIYLKQVSFKKEVEPKIVYSEEKLDKQIASSETNHIYQMVTIEDNGSGMPENIKHKIFDPFFTTKAPGKGTGLGLGIAKNIVDKHNGFISFSSWPGKTRFHIYIPYIEGELDENEDGLSN